MGYGSLSRQEIIEALSKRDGYQCYFPECDKPFSETNLPTIDHWYPQEYCKKNGWTYEEIHDLSNLKLLCRTHNILKNNIVPNADGSVDLPARRPYTAKSERQAVCDTCYSGRLLFAGEFCDVCGSGPQPATAPQYLQVNVKDCDHDTNFCSFCYIGIYPRKSALEKLISG